MEIAHGLLQALLHGFYAVAAVGVVLFLILLTTEEAVRKAVVQLMALATIICFLVLLAFLAQKGFQITPEGSNALLAAAGYAISTTVVLLFLYAWIKLSPLLYKRLTAWVYFNLRGSFLNALKAAYAPRVKDASTFRLDKLVAALESHELLQITGPAGSGKTTLLQQLLVHLVNEAQKPGRPVFVIPIEVDASLAIPHAGDRLETLELRFFDNGFLTRWMARHAPELEKEVVYLVDVFFQDSLALETHRAVQLGEFLEDLPFKPKKTRLVVASAQNLVVGYMHLAPFVLEDLTNAEITHLACTLLGVKTNPMEPALLSSPLCLALARRPLLLAHIAAYYTANARLPENLLALFRKALYPPDLSSGEVETFITSLAARLLDVKDSLVPVEELDSLLASKLPGLARKRPFLEKLRQGGLLLAVSSGPRRFRRAGFGRPLYLALGAALAQKGGLADIFTSDNLKQILRDPFLQDAFLIYNSMPVDLARFNGLLSDYAIRSELNARPWVAKCLLVRPSLDEHASLLVDQIVDLQIAQLAQGDEAARRAWSLLEYWDPPHRVQFYLLILTSFETNILEKILTWLVKNQPGDYDLLLRSATGALADNAAAVLIVQDQARALRLFQSMYAADDCRNLSIRYLGYLKRDDAAPVLFQMLKEQPDPDLREEILSSLVRCGAEPYPALVGILTNRAEPDSLRISAAALLADHWDPDKQTQETLLGLRRALQMPLPDQAREFLRSIFARM